MDVSKRFYDGEHKCFLGMKGECEVFCVKLILCTDILIFRIFEYGAESGAECSAESGVK